MTAQSALTAVAWGEDLGKAIQEFGGLWQGALGPARALAGVSRVGKPYNLL